MSRKILDGLTRLAAVALIGSLSTCGKAHSDNRTQASAPVPSQTSAVSRWIGTETVHTRFGDFEFKNGYPTADAADKLYELRTFGRAVESYLHFVTIMSMFCMQKGLT